MNYYRSRYETDITRDYKVPQRFLDHLEARAALDRAEEERYGARKGQSVFAFTPFNRHHFSLMVSQTLEMTANGLYGYDEMQYLDGMITGWFCGFQESSRKSSQKSKGYAYTAGRESGSRLFHFLESETIIREVRDGRLPHDERFARYTPSTQKYLEIDFDRYMFHRNSIWHLPSNCDECAQLIKEENRIIGQLDGTEEDAQGYFECGMARSALRDMAFGKRFIREDAKKAKEFDELWEFLFGEKPRVNPYKISKH
jgi:hypothetical protein